MNAASKDRPSPRAFHIWHGMTLAAWARALARNRFGITADRSWTVLSISCFSLVNSCFALLQRLLFGRRTDREAIPTPVFIIGNARSGTTFLHELLATDERFLFPKTFECFCPDFFMVTAGVFGRLSKLTSRRILPYRRPMDDMEMGWERPQEDEFALLNMGVRSSYEIFAFPEERLRRPWPLDPDEFTEADRRIWQTAFLRFLKRVSLQRRRKRKCAEWRWLVLKSPPHTARVRTLHRMFPGARFIHLVRNPYEMFASNVKMLTALIASESCQSLAEGPSTAERLHEHVFAQLDRLYLDFESAMQSLGPGQFSEVRYEELIRDPVGMLRRIYRELGLGELDAGGTALTEYLAAMSRYQPNRHELDTESAAKIHTRWAWYFDRFGYEPIRSPRSSSDLRATNSLTEKHDERNAAKASD